MKATVGLIEEVIIFNHTKSRKVMARIDTGAKSNSIDKQLAKELNILAGEQTTVVKSAMGQMVRHVVDIEVEIAGKRLRGRFTLASRAHLKYPMLIGRDILKQGFLIDPDK